MINLLSSLSFFVYAVARLITSTPVAIRAVLSRKRQNNEILMNVVVYALKFHQVR